MYGFVPRRRVLRVNEGSEERRHRERVMRVLWDMGLPESVGRCCEWMGESEGRQEIAWRMVGVVVRRIIFTLAGLYSNDDYVSLGIWASSAVQQFNPVSVFTRQKHLLAGTRLPDRITRD